MKVKPPKLRLFIEACLKQGITTPNDMQAAYTKQHHKTIKTHSFIVTLGRMGLDHDKLLTLKLEQQKQEETKDISDYEEWKRYFGFADFQQIGQRQKKRTSLNLRKLWDWMGRTDPHTWKFVEGEDSLIAKLKQQIGQDERGQWKSQQKIIELLGSYNRVFQGYLPKGWSMGLKRPAGELKDFIEPETFAEFIQNLTTTEDMTREGWIALFECQVTMGCREGTRGDTGIVSLKWEDINYETMRCKIRDKGEKGKPARLWTEIPLQLFPWIPAWDCLMHYHMQRYGYLPTNSKHESGLCFTVNYHQYNQQFHATRHKCQNELAQDDETHVPHIMRKTHAQWCRRIGISLDNICGDTDSTPSIGRYGVGWTDRNIPARYYITKEAWEYEEQDKIIQEHLERLGK